MVLLLNCSTFMLAIIFLFFSSQAHRLYRTANNGPAALNNSLWINDCSTADDKTRMELVSYNITPNPPKKGDKINFDVKFELKEVITSGIIHVIAKFEVYGHLKTIFDKSLDLCDLIQQTGVSCPLQVGTLPLKIFGEKLPDFILSGTYTGNATITDQNGKETFCLEAGMII